MKSDHEGANAASFRLVSRYGVFFVVYCDRVVHHVKFRPRQTRRRSPTAGLARLTRLPAGHWTGERAATDILTLARKRRAFASLDALIARQGGRQVLYGSALALAAALQAWARQRRHPAHRSGAHCRPLKPGTIRAIRGQCCDDGWNPPGLKWPRLPVVAAAGMVVSA